MEPVQESLYEASPLWRLPSLQEDTLLNDVFRATLRPEFTRRWQQLIEKMRGQYGHPVVRLFRTLQSEPEQLERAAELHHRLSRGK